MNDEDDWYSDMSKTDLSMMNLEFQIGVINLEIMECCYHIQVIKCLLSDKS